MKPSSWRETFLNLFHLAVEKYRTGHQKPAGLVDEAGGKFLRSIGYTEQEFFDFVEDFARDGQPGVETAMEIAAVRRDYFLNEQNGEFSGRQISMADLPPKDATLDGIAWLPRIIPKAEAKLRGEMPPDLMYGCGGDRKFFRAQKVDPAEFLSRVWRAAGRTDEIVAWVKTSQATDRPDTD